MRLVWDEVKRLRNLARHGLDFADAETFGWPEAVIAPGHLHLRGPARSVAIGHLGTRLVAVVFSRLGTEALSLVSMRPASRAERRRYASS